MPVTLDVRAIRRRGDRVGVDGSTLLGPRKASPESDFSRLSAPRTMSGSSASRDESPRSLALILTTRRCGCVLKFLGGLSGLMGLPVDSGLSRSNKDKGIAILVADCLLGRVSGAVLSGESVVHCLEDSDDRTVGRP